MQINFPHLMNSWKRITLVSIHHKNVEALATEMYKVSNMSPTITNNIFATRPTSYNLRNQTASVNFKMRKVYLFYNGTETLSHLGPKIWSLVPLEIKQSVSLGDFKSKVKNWTRPHLIVPADYATEYLHQVGFI